LALVAACVVVAGTLSLLGTGVTHAQGPDDYGVYYVAPGGNCGVGAEPCYSTVQAAVDAADDPDDVVKVATGVYTGVNHYGDWAQMVYVSKTVTIRGGYATDDWDTSDPGANLTTLDVGGAGRVFYVTGEISPTVEGLHITGGGVYGGGSGGGMHVITAAVTVSACQIAANTAFLGGGVYVEGSSNAVIDGNVIFSNTASFGGGLYLGQSTGVTLRGNTILSHTTYGAGGIMIYASDDVVLIDNTFRANAAAGQGRGSPSDGGAIYLYDVDNATLSGNVILDNAALLGGGIALYDADGAVLNGNVILGNQAIVGGGIHLSESDDAVLDNNIVADNQASAGGGICLWGSDARLRHTTLARNDGGDGSGIYVDDVYGSSTAHLTNTILVSHTVGITVTTGNTVTLESTLWSDNAVNWGGGGTISHGNDHSGDPAFVQPDAGDYHIGAASAARDAGVDAGVRGDVDGQARPHGAGYDVGADEFYPDFALAVSKQASSIAVTPGASLTYTLRVTNTGTMDLHATITDTLPLHIVPIGTAIVPGGQITWTAIITAPGGVWAETVVVTVAQDYDGPLTNRVTVTTEEGAVGEAYVTVNSRVYLPLLLRDDAP
jgi:uncharacterized repeat protein (TIGR01451 family)